MPFQLRLQATHTQTPHKSPTIPHNNAQSSPLVMKQYPQMSRPDGNAEAEGVLADILKGNIPERDSNGFVEIKFGPEMDSSYYGALASKKTVAEQVVYYGEQVLAELDNGGFFFEPIEKIVDKFSNEPAPTFRDVTTSRIARAKNQPDGDFTYELKFLKTITYNFREVRKEVNDWRMGLLFQP